MKVFVSMKYFVDFLIVKLSKIAISALTKWTKCTKIARIQLAKWSKMKQNEPKWTEMNQN